MLKNGIAKKILFIVIASIVILVMAQGTVSANDQKWEGKTDGLGGLNWWQDQEGETYSGENYGIKWIATITQTNDTGGQVGKVSLKITNTEEITGNVELPDYITGKGFLVSSYLYEIETIENDAFRDSKMLEKVTLGRFVKTIGNNAFYNCTSLKEVIIGESVNNIGNKAFYNCTSLKEISISENVNTIGEDAFYNCSSLDKVIVNQNNANFSNDESGVLFNKDKTKLIYYPTGKKEEIYTISNNVQYIGKNAFAMNQALKTINIPESVKEICFGAFQNCSNLQKINFLGNSNINTIDEGVFFGCNNLISIQIPESVTVIKKSAFESCKSLKEIKLPSGLKTISESLFENCQNLEKIELPAKLEVIDINAFNGSGLKYIEIPQGTTTINNLAFYKSDLITAVIPNTISTMGEHVFEGNKNLIVYGYNCDESKMAEWHSKGAIPGYAVCEGINSNPTEDDMADYVEINKFVEGTAVEVDLLSHVYGLPVKVLDEASFKGNENIQKIKLPKTIITMWDQVFFGCKSLNNLVIPKSVTNIPDRAFANCPSLTKLVIRKGSEIYTIGNEVFLGDSKSLVVYHDGENDIINTYTQNNKKVNIKIDNEAPYADTRPVIDDDSKTSVTLVLENIRDREGGSGAELYVITTEENVDEIEENEWKTVTSEAVLKKVNENRNYYIYIADMVGNISQNTIEVNEIDDQMPDIILDENDINYSRHGAIIQVTFKEEEEGSGLLKWAVSKKENVNEILEEEWKKDITGYEQTISELLETNGLWYIYVMDKAENINSKLLHINKIDNIAPVIGSINQKLIKKEYVEANIYLYENDSGYMSGLAAYSIDTKETVDANTEWIQIDGKPMSKDIKGIVEANGMHYVHIKDDYGNVASKGFETEGIEDSIAPRVKFVDKTNNNIKIKITDAFSGIAEGAKISYGWSTTTDKEPETFKAVELKYEAGAKEVIAEVPCDGQGIYYLCLNIEELKDVDGNANTQGKIYSDSYEFDTVLPEIVNYICDTKVLRNGTKSTFQLNFSEPVVYVDTEELTISGEGADKCILSEITPVSSDGLVWQFTLTGGTGNGKAIINIPYGIFKDMTGNTLKNSGTITVTIDNTPPKLSEEITVNDKILKQGQEVIFILEFEEAVWVNEDKFTDVLSTNENANLKILENPTSSNNNKLWNITFEAGTGDGEVEIHLPKGFFEDELGNEVESISLGFIRIDNTLPKLEITQLETDDINLNVNLYSTREYMITSDEKVQMGEGKIEIKAVNDTDIITGNVVVEPIGTEGKQWKVTVTEFEGDGLVKLVIPSGFFVDEAGNKNPFTEKNIVTVDSTAAIIESIKDPYLDKETGKAVIEIKLQNLNKQLRYAMTTESELTLEMLEELLVNNSKEITSNPFKAEVEEAGEYYIYIFDSLLNILILDPIKVEESVFNVTELTITVEGPEKVILKNGQTEEYKLIPSEEVKITEDEEIVPQLIGNARGSKMEIYFDEEQNVWIVKVIAGEINGDLRVIIPKGYFEDLLGNKVENDIIISGIMVDNTAPVITGITDPTLDDTKEKAIIEVSVENSDEKLEYVISTSDMVENITEEWKPILENPFKIEIATPGIYYVYVRDEAGNITKSQKIEIKKELFDIVPPTADVTYDIEDGKVKVIITANEKIQLPDGWNYSNENKTIIEKIFEQDTNEKITIKDLGNNTVEVPVNVKLITNLSLNKTELTLEKGISEKLTATIEPENVTNNQLIWSSSNSNIANVDQYGKVTAVSEGIATITVTTLEGNKTQSCQVTVITDQLILVLKDGSKYEINKEDETLYIENIESNTKIEDVLKDIETNGNIKVYKDEDEQIDMTQRITTGMSIKATKGKQEKILIVVVKGDCNGSGTCNVSDLTKLKKSIAESLATNKDVSKILTGAFARAVDFNKDRKLNSSDITNLCKYIAENK